MERFPDNVTLCGRGFHHIPMKNGARELVADDGGDISDAEWDAYCDLADQRCKENLKEIRAKYNRVPEHL